MYWRILFVTCCALMVAEPALALRCGGKLVSPGAPQGKVLKYCGEPEAVAVRTIIRAGLPRRQPHRHVGTMRPERDLLYADRAYSEVVVEEWTYNFGPRRLMRVIRFENGLVTSIRQLGYGYH